MPVTAATAAMSTASTSQVNQLMTATAYTAKGEAITTTDCKR
jgi:hypothetical protein